MEEKTEILIIGGGVIGILTAYYLNQEGKEVTLIDANEICSGASYGNAGFILPSHVVPLSSPGVMGQGLKWLLNPVSPFYIKPRLSLDLISWLYRFRAASEMGRVRTSMNILKSLEDKSFELFHDLIGKDLFDFGYQEKGHLKIFRTREGFKKAAEEAGFMDEARINNRMVDSHEVYEIEPNLKPGIHGGLYFPDDAHLNPADLVKGLGSLIEEKGVKIRPHTEVLDFDLAKGPGARRSINTVMTTKGDIKPEQVVLATGSWSPLLAKRLGLKLPIQAAKGYSLTYENNERTPKIPLILGEIAVAASPLGDVFRLAGTLELAGLDMSINLRRLKSLLKGTLKYLYLDDLKLKEIWRGLRPCLPDGLPVIGRTDKIDNLIIATGHGMLGMGLGPVTGKLVQEIVSEKEPSIAIRGLRPERFS